MFLSNPDHAWRPFKVRTFYDKIIKCDIALIICETGCIMSVWDKTCLSEPKLIKQIGIDTTEFNDTKSTNILNKYIDVYNNVDELFKEYEDIGKVLNGLPRNI